jgi:hypothetical protein
MKKFIFFALLWLIIFLFPSINYSQTHFTANLTGDQENPAVTTSAKGTGSFTLTAAGLEFNLTVEGLTFTAAHFHNGAIGVNGGVVRGITSDFTVNTASGIWTSTDAQPLTPELVADLLAGNLYVNIHTAANPGGEIRGQVILSAGTGFTANLDGDQEVPSVTTNATGTASLTLTGAGLAFSLTVEGLTFTAAHFHNGALGANGPVVRAITSDFTGNTASGLWTSTDSEPLTPGLINELLAGNIYINVHTTANPGGEIRGQVNLKSGTGLTAKLTGDQENPAVTTSATGTGSFTLTAAGLEFDLTVEGLTFTAAHFHNGAIGVNGGVVRTITNDFAGNTASGIWTSSDTEPLTPGLIADLLAGNLYINVHTAANPGGEIRGQVNLSAGTGFSSNLDGNQEVPPVTTNATGTASLTLTGAGLEFSLTVEGLTFTAAHFHNAAVGVNGGVVRTITNDFAGNTASGLWSSTDSEPLTPGLINELLAGNIYINVHTTANPGGEIRGQLNVTAVIIPVELTSFTADVINGSVELNWSTATETNNSGFEIQRRVEFTQWDKVGFVTGRGTTTESQTYSYTDKLVKNGSYSYRLKQIDYDGSFEYSDVVDVEVTAPIEFALHQNYPNPFNPSTTIRFELKLSGQTLLKIYDLLGKEVFRLVDEELEAGAYKVTFDANALSSGIYYYRLETSSFNQVRKMILLK